MILTLAELPLDRNSDKYKLKLQENQISESMIRHLLSIPILEKSLILMILFSGMIWNKPTSVISMDTNSKISIGLMSFWSKRLSQSSEKDRRADTGNSSIMRMTREISWVNNNMKMRKWHQLMKKKSRLQGIKRKLAKRH